MSRIKTVFGMAFLAILIVLAASAISGAAATTYVGSEKCKTCHPNQYKQLQNSIHSKMIRDASALENVHGNLSDPNAPKPSDITYVIGGWYKEESYIKVSGDKYNVTNFEWDPIKQHYANDKSIRDWLVMCAGCHTTGYDTATKKFQELNIGCEACHGPGSKHVASVNKTDIVIDKSSEACGYCHIRATQMDGPFNFPVGYILGQSSTLKYIPEPYNATASFFPDGTSKRHRQQYLDVKTSKHYTAGVTCASCHDAHESGNISVYQSLPAGTFGVAIFNNPAKTTSFAAWSGDGLKKPKQEICKTCHATKSEYHIHNFTAAAKAASITCTDCHMPDVINVDSKTLRGALTTHNFKSLSPENSIKYGADTMPNSCTYRCHQEKGANNTERASWALKALAAPITTPTPTPTPTKPAPGFEVGLAAIGISGIAYLLRRIKIKK